MSAPDELDLFSIRSAVDAWKIGEAEGASLEDNLNLAGYAAMILPRLCDELESARAALSRLHALCDRRAAGDGAFLVVGEVRRVLKGSP